MEEKKDKKNDFNKLLREVILPKVELISLLILVISIIFRFINMEVYLKMINISLSTLAVTQFFGSYGKKIKGLLNTISVKIGSISSAVVLIGIMFYIMSLPGYYDMLTIGLIALGLASAISIYSFIKSDSKNYKKFLIRFVVVFVAGLYFYLTL